MDDKTRGSIADRLLEEVMSIKPCSFQGNEDRVCSCLCRIDDDFAKNRLFPFLEDRPASGQEDFFSAPRHEIAISYLLSAFS